MDNVNSIFPTPLYFGKIEIEDIEIPKFDEGQNVLRHEVPV